MRLLRLILLAHVVATLAGCGAAGGAEGEELVCRFVGEFVASGFLDGSSDAIFLDVLDPQFVLVVRAQQVRAGALPGDGKALLRFAVHSPAMFFGERGISLPEGRYHPVGIYLFSLRRRPDHQGFALDVVPVSP